MTTFSNCMISRTEYSFLSQQSVISALRTKARFLSVNRISELVWDSKREEAGTPSNSFSEDKEGFQDKPGVSHLQPDCPTSSEQASSSLLSSASDEEEVFRVDQANRSKHHPLHSGHSPLALISVAHTFTWGPREKRDSEAPHINDSSSPLGVFLLYFAEIITLMVVETNRYYHDHLDRLDKEPSPLPDVTEAEMLVS